MTTTPARSKVPEARPCKLRQFDHRYIYEPTGQRMKKSVTGVTNYFKDPNRFWGKDATTQRDIGIHVHDWLHVHLTKATHQVDYQCPEGHDCTPWIKALLEDETLQTAQILASEFTMVDCEKSLGGQLDLLIEDEGKVILVDLKTKTKNFKAASRSDKLGYRQQAGGYLTLFQSGTDAGNARHIEIHECQTMIVKPWEVIWLDPYTPQSCMNAWGESWGKYAAAALTAF